MTHIFIYSFWMGLAAGMAVGAWGTGSGKSAFVRAWGCAVLLVLWGGAAAGMLGGGAGVEAAMVWLAITGVWSGLLLVEVICRLKRTISLHHGDGLSRRKIRGLPGRGLHLPKVKIRAVR